MTNNNKGDSLILSQPIHPKFRTSNVAAIGSIKKKFLPESFSQRFSSSLVKLLELKGLKVSLLKHQHSMLYHPELESSFDDLLTFEIISDQKKMGYLYLEANFVTLLLHKLLGGSDKITPCKVALPLNPIEAKSLETAYAVFNVSLREALKHSFPLREIDLIKLRGPIDPLQFSNHLNYTHQYLNEEFSFRGQSQLKLTVLLDFELFSSFGK